MKQKRNRIFLQLLLASAVVFGLARETRANSYASSLTNNAGVVSFRLNDAADSVKVVGNNGALTIDLGPLPLGLTVTNLTSQGLTAGVFKVVVAKDGTGEPGLIGSPVAFNSPRGVTVNQNPASPYFGWVYVANSAGGTKGDGMFAFTADLFDILGQGATAKTADLAGNFATGTSSSPFRPKVGWGDDKVYVADWSDGAGNLYRFMPDLSQDPDGSYVLLPLTGTAAVPVGVENNHGSIAAVEVLGSLANGDLQVYTIDEDYQSDPTQTGSTEINSLWRYDIGAGPLPWDQPPVGPIAKATIDFVSQEMDLAYSPTTGYFYISDRRDNGTEASVRVFDKDGNQLFDSLQASRDLGNANDVLVALRGGVAASYDGKYMAALNTANNLIIIPMIQGIPDLATRKVFNLGSTTTIARGVAFDRANNLYAVSSGMAILQAVTIGYSATNTTSSDGVFTQIAPEIQAAKVSAQVFDPGTGLVDLIAEGDVATVATIKVSRVVNDNSNPMTVNFTAGGTATRGTSDTTGDYYLRVGGTTLTGNSIVIPAGQDQVLVEVVANEDAVSEPIETAAISIAPGAYTVTADSTATVSIADNDPVAFEVSSAVFPRAFEGNPFDLLRFQLQRLGDTNAGPVDVNLQYSGTATSGTDYTAVATVTINPGDLTATFDVLVLPDSAIEGDETVTVSVAPGTGYAVGPNNGGATGILVDDDFPAENVLFSEDFNDPNKTYDWTVRFGSINPDSQDYSATFGFDYGQDGFGIPPAPHSNGDTHGLLVSVNKLDALAEAAGVNLYPNGKDFSGNYALRFDMYLLQGSGAGTTEHAMFGINHDTLHTNWFSNAAAGVPTGWNFDGIFAAVITDASDLGDYLLLSAPQAGVFGPTTLAQRSASTLTDVFHNPPWTPGGGAGSPGNDPTTLTPSWAQVELRQTNNTVTLIINQTNIFSYANSTAFTHGDIMLGYEDSFNSIGTGGLVLYDNVRVVQLGGGAAPEVHVSTIARSGNTVTIDFTAGSGEPITAFKLVSAPAVTGPYTDDNTATITSQGGSNYRITTTATDAMRFYQVRRTP